MLNKTNTKIIVFQIFMKIIYIINKLRIKDIRESECIMSMKNILHLHEKYNYFIS